MKKTTHINKATIIAFVVNCLMLVGYTLKGMEMDFFTNQILLSLFVNEVLKDSEFE